MSKKTKKSTKKVNLPKDLFKFGLECEQKLADLICDTIPDKYQEKLDEAFIGAFKGLSYRMLQIFEKEFVVDLLQEMVHLQSEESTHVCEDCIDGVEPVSDETRNKMH